MNQPSTPKPRLVCVASFLSSAEGELARTRLAADGIHANLENCYLVLWKWLYSNAVGGVKVYVPEADADLAYDILHPDDETEGVDRPSITCQECNAGFDADWRICWRCGTTTDGRRDPDFFAPPPEDASSIKYSPVLMAAAVVSIGLFLLAATGGWSEPFVFWLVAVFFVLGLRAVWPPIADETAGPIESADQTDDNETEPASYSTVEDLVFRAWKSAFFGLAYIPLFTLYALWLQLRARALLIDMDDSDINRRERRRYFVTWFLCLVTLSMYVMIPFACLVFQWMYAASSNEYYNPYPLDRPF